ncbi:1-acyl-sn-glycerol-3-phosphate acyltransferase [Azorhizobium oxalatiphilum]|uniref:1-acyl-sn-glycerol-3-phosphate acyltransferase n=1 Tax=Azorhizobium oxalatiphilum TaxID=980631 RepID=A0A917FG75_9HYPH|nr:lysophospholipid acyltransferase family protein [Azorhizobium oxalatiphilum]GGF76243.1 1-acyl-sn-glycerol-3-phosphate acyltransferase [Azorhizobium oxalatiphilum]
MTLLRSLLFQLAFYCMTILFMLLYLPLLPFLSRRGLWRGLVVPWSRTTSFLLRVIAGTKVEIKGRENIPEGPLLIASKHQSAWETIALLPLFSDPAFILKRELMWLPIFGWYAAKAQMIPINRGTRTKALKAMTLRAREELAKGRQILIFPEGTRRPAGAPPAYKFGVSHLYSAFGVPCLPVALNSGLYWPRNALIRRPGTIRVEVLPVIPPGLKREVFFERLQGDIETASDRLVAMGRAELGMPSDPTPQAV